MLWQRGRRRSRPTAAFPISPRPTAAARSAAGRVDGFGLPRYRYTIDEETAAQARQPELNGATDAWHQLGNDHIVANAYNHGYVQLWSQDRRYQWANHYEAGAGHYAGGYGYLQRRRPDASARSTTTAPAGARTERDFGVGYFAPHAPPRRRRRRRRARLRAVRRRPAAAARRDDHEHDAPARSGPSWFEYWDVNPYDQDRTTHLGLAAPRYDARDATLSVAPAPPDAGSTEPADDLRRRARAARSAATRPTRARSSARGGRAAPGRGGRRQALGRDRAAGAGRRSRAHAVRLPRAGARCGPGSRSRCATPTAWRTPRRSRRSSRSWRARRRPVRAQRARVGGWRAAGRPSAGQQRWLARELAVGRLHAALGRDLRGVRCGHHIISQGGYYQYDLGFQGAFRDPLQHMLPMIYADPGPGPRGAAATPRRSSDRASGADPVRDGPAVQAASTSGTSNDLDLWLLLAAAEYGLARATSRSSTSRCRWARRRHRHAVGAPQGAPSPTRSRLRGPHGGYIAGTTATGRTSRRSSCR